MNGQKSRTLLVLDFDGVICDSIDECFVSSWIAYHELFRNAGAAGGPPPRRSAPQRSPAAQIAESLPAARRPESSPAARGDFARLRPFIRTGEDFVLIQEMLAAGATVDNQAAFDQAARSAGPQKLALFRDFFYQARAELLDKDRESWLAMNRIYPHVAAAFSRFSPEVPVRILSTKRPRFIAEILAAHRIDLAERQILQSGSVPKLAVVEGLRYEGGFESAIFVEDQIDHIRGNANPRIRAYLATWGYVKEDWLRDPTAPLLSPDGFQKLLQAEYGLP